MLKALILSILVLATAFAAAQDAQIKPGDRLRLLCEEEATLNREYTVSDQGIILVDFLGAIKVEGLTEQEAAMAIAKRLIDDRILRQATVSVKIVGSKTRPIIFKGAVPVTGQAEHHKDMRLSHIVRLVFANEKTDLTRVEIETIDGKKTYIDFTRFDPATNENNPLLQPGDTVTFFAKQRPGMIVMLGGVVRPGGVDYEPGMTLRQAIAKAGGFTSLAVPTRVKVERDGRPAVVLDLTRRGTDMVLLEGDRVIVEVRDQRRYVHVTGAVRRPGYVEYRSGLTLSEAIAASGGTRPGARRDSVKLSSSGDGRTVREFNLDGMLLDPVLAPGDRIRVEGSRGQNLDFLKAITVLVLLYILLGR
ncbi:MAG: SLBB domain-containing protein [Armatimonadetes bacterium]|nr:SLBB domain-containing protein [Armatimonadota bacterium]